MGLSVADPVQIHVAFIIDLSWACIFLKKKKDLLVAGVGNSWVLKWLMIQKKKNPNKTKTKI